jgi:hypothetical protein
MTRAKIRRAPPGLSGVTAIAAGYVHSLALKSDGTVIGWGRNDSGQITIPAGLNGVIAIAAGYDPTGPTAALLQPSIEMLGAVR